MAVLTIKKYGNRRLYDTEASRYITLEELALLIRQGREVKVVDAKSGEDLTKSVLLQVISEQERGEDVLPVSLLRRIVQVGDSSMREGREHFKRYLAQTFDVAADMQRELEQRYRAALQGGLFNPMGWMAPQAFAAPPPPPTPVPDPEPTPKTVPSKRKRGRAKPRPKAEAQTLEQLEAQLKQMRAIIDQLKPK